MACPPRTRTKSWECTRRWKNWRGCDARLVQVVEMRYFAGMTEAEIAVALGINDRTVRRDWQKARLLLADALKRT